MHIVGGGFGQTCAEIFQKQNQFWADPISLSSGDTMVKGLPKELFLNVPFLASFSLFSSFQQLTENMFIIIFLPMTELEPQTYGIGSDRSTNWATTTAAVDVRYKPENLIDFIIFLYMDLGLFLYIRLWKNLLRIRCTIWGGDSNMGGQYEDNHRANGILHTMVIITYLSEGCYLCKRLKFSN